MTDTQFWTMILCVFSLGLLMIQFFRQNILFCVAGIMVNIGITQIVGAPKWLIYSAVLLAVGEGVAMVMKMIAGKRKAGKRFTG